MWHFLEKLVSVADPRERDRHELLEEMPHALAAERDLETDRHTNAQTEVRDGPARLGDDRALTSDRRDVARRGVHGLGGPDRLAHAGVQDALLALRDLRHVWIPELLARFL